MRAKPVQPEPTERHCDPEAVAQDMGRTSVDQDEFDLLEMLSILRRRWVLMFVTVATVVLGGAVYTGAASPLYKATVAMLVDTGSGARSGADDIALLDDLRSFTRARSVETQTEVIGSEAVYGQALGRLSPEQRARVVGRPQVKSTRNTDVISIAVASTDPGLAARLANLVADQYTYYNKETNRQQTQAARQYVAQQLTEVRVNLSAAQQRLKQFKQRNLTVDLTAESQRLVDQIATLETDLQTNQADLAASRAELRSKTRSIADTPRGRVPAEQLAAGPTVERVKQRLVELELQRSELLQKYRPSSPEVRRAEQQIRDARAQLAAEARTALAQDVAPFQVRTWSLEARTAALASALTGTRARLTVLPQLEYELAQLTTDQEALGSTYRMLNEQYQRLRISEEARLASARVISPAAAPASPFLPRRGLNLALAAVIGLLLSLALAVVTDRVDQRLHSEADVLSLVPSGILGHVPYLRAVEDLHLTGEEARSSGTLEAFRTLRSNILLSSADTPVRSLLVTSPMPGEGKTEVASNLAIAAAMDHKRVVLIDGDLRRPRVHRRFGLANELGVTSLAVGVSDLEHTAQDTTVPGLRVVSSGPVPPNPPELLNSQTWKDCLRQVVESSDLVIVDSPPAAMFTDAQILAGMTDATLLIVSAREGQRLALRRTVDLLRRAGAKVVGAVVNKAYPAFAKGIGKGSYYYYYYDYYPYYEQDGNDDRDDRGAARRRGNRRHRHST